MNRDHPAFADWDAAYVLGALTPADRRTFEEHLLSCELCRVAVAELAPLPGLLARAAAPEPDAQDPGRPGPAAQAVSPRADLADLVARRAVRERRAERERRTSRVRRGLAAVAVTAAMVLAVVLVVPRGGEAPGPTTAPDATVTLVQAADVSLTASVRLTSVAWGTRIAMECDYPAGNPQGPGPYPGSGDSYALVVTDSAGTSSQVSTWTAVPGRTVHLDAATAVPLAEIASVEVRSAQTGRLLLSADLG
ncbi:zf-HC2 domain-containing protein [Antribacter sp. KLBMP9083]|uniref:Zf-HC2 domain-containing protein n=1 Tax=Antribacter soli TaxID=2910976 RepID=A0AA41QF03_9MICO|nr:zf-HC2 domain-containing protein [Antribacter soli]MCF4120879.1 zf-HC2 domain-containing protein [Antribacter soli]